jgi:hypothetical protein
MLAHCVTTLTRPSGYTAQRRGARRTGSRRTGSASRTLPRPSAQLRRVQRIPDRDGRQPGLDDRVGEVRLGGDPDVMPRRAHATLGRPVWNGSTPCSTSPTTSTTTSRRPARHRHTLPTTPHRAQVAPRANRRSDAHQPATVLDRFHRQPTNFGIATQLLANLDDDPTRIHDLLLNLLTGTTDQRQRATHLALRLDPATATGTGILIPLIGDPVPPCTSRRRRTGQPGRRRSHHPAHPHDAEAQPRRPRHPRCATVALVLADVALTDNTRALLNDLKDHPSAIVRHTANTAIGCESEALRLWWRL